MKSTKKITQASLEEYRSKLVRKSNLKSELEALDEAIDMQSDILVARVKAGWVTEKGPLTGAIEVVAGQRRPKWKEVVLERCGIEVVNEVVKKTPKSPDKERFEVLEKVVRE